MSSSETTDAGDGPRTRDDRLDMLVAAIAADFTAYSRGMAALMRDFPPADGHYWAIARQPGGSYRVAQWPYTSEID